MNSAKLLKQIQNNPALFAKIVNTSRGMVGNRVMTQVGKMPVKLVVTANSPAKSILAASLAMAHNFPAQYAAAARNATGAGLGAVNATQVNANDINAVSNLITAGAQAATTVTGIFSNIFGGKQAQAAPPAKAPYNPNAGGPPQTYNVDDGKIFGLPPIAVYGGAAVLAAGVLMLALPKKK